MKFCCLCGGAVKIQVPQGDNRERFVCRQCDTIHYQNPNIVAGCIVTAGEQVLMAKRAIEPRYGYWTVPAGFMENQESTQEAALRETVEEARAQVEGLHLFGVYNLIHINQVYMLFRGTLVGDQHAPGAESLETALLDEADIPWDALAFPVIDLALRQFFDDRRAGRYRLHSANLVREPGPDKAFRIDHLE